VKKVIELLEDADKYVFSISVHGDARKNVEFRDMANRLIQEAIVLLKAPRFETPEQYRKRTGEPWPDDWAVYCRYRCNGYSLQGKWHGETYSQIKNEEYGLDQKQIVIATEAGPPPDDWRPE
jgi:hypothetical protein